MSHFEKSFIAKFTPYFNNLKDCLCSLCKAIFANGFWDNTAEHHLVLKILRETYNSLLDEEDTCSTRTNAPSQASSSQGVPSDEHRVSKSANRRSNRRLYSAGTKTPKSGSSGVRKRQANQSAVDSLLGSSGGSRTSKKRREYL